MATMPYTRTLLGGTTSTLEDGNVVIDGKIGAGISCVWGALLNSGDVGTPLNFGQFSDRTVQVEGTFGTVVIEGTLDGNNWHTLTDPSGNPLSFTSSDLRAITEMTAQIRPRLTAGTGVGVVVRIDCCIGDK